MAPKPGFVSNAIESLAEQAKVVGRDVKRQLDPRDILRLYVDPEHKFKTKEELEQIENRERMEKFEGFKQARRELNALQGNVVSEETIDQETRKYIEEEEKRLAQNLQNFDLTSRNTAESLGQEAPQAEAQAEQQKEAAEEQQKEAEKAEEQASLENVPETQSKVTGLNPKFKRMRNPWKTAPRSTEKLKRASSKIGSGAEQRAGRGVGG